MTSADKKPFSFVNVLVAAVAATLAFSGILFAVVQHPILGALLIFLALIAADES